MAVKLRLTRRGKKKQPFYRIVAIDSRTARDGKYIEKIGYYNPLPERAEILIDEEKAFYWLNQGAIPTDTVKNLFSQKGIILKWTLKKKGLDEAKVQEEINKWEVIQLEKQRKREASAAQAERDKATSKEQQVEVNKEQETAAQETTMETKADAPPILAEQTPVAASEIKPDELPADKVDDPKSEEK